MRIEGDIKVWVDGEKACARLTADGPEGPILIHASAPLAPIRKLVERQFTARGVTVSGEDPAFSATVKRIARRRALRRLKRIAPSAFKRGGLGPYLAAQELRRRRRHRRAMGQASEPVGSKPLGPLPRRRHRRWRRGLSWLQRERLRAVAAIQRPALLSALPVATTATALTVARPSAPAALAAATPSSAPGGSGGGGGGAADSAPPAAAAPVDPEAADEQASPDDEQEAVTDEASSDAAEEAGTDRDGAEGSEDSDEQQGGAEDSEEVSGDASDERRAIAQARLRAAMRLLALARRSPRARQKIHVIATLAGQGHPEARKAMATLSKAHKIQKARDVRARAIVRRGKTVTPPVFKEKPLLAPPAAPPPAPAPSGAPPTAPAPAADQGRDRWWDLLAVWRRGIG